MADEDLKITIEAKATGLEDLREVKDGIDDIRNAMTELELERFAATMANILPSFGQVGSAITGFTTAVVGAIPWVGGFLAQVAQIPYVGGLAVAALAALTLALLGVLSAFALTLAGATVFIATTAAGFTALGVAATLALGPIGALAAAVIFLTDHAFTDQQKAIKQQIADLGAQRDAAIAAETWTKAQQEEYTETVAGLKAQLAGLHDPLGQIEQDFGAMLDAWGTKAAPFAAQIIDWLDSLIPQVTQAGNAVVDWFGDRLPFAFDLAKRAIEPIIGFFKALGDIIGPFIDRVMVRLIGTWSVDWPAAGKLALEALKNLLDNLVKFVDWFFENWPKIQPIVQQVMQKAGEFIQNFGKIAAETVDWFVKNWPEITRVAKELEPVLQVLEFLLTVLVVALLGLAQIADQVVGALGKIRDAFQGAAGAALDFRAAASGAPGLSGLIAAGIDFVAPSGGGRRQAGGPVLPGGVYTVGERGPETLVMGQSGGVVIPGGGTDMDDTNELLGAIYRVLNQIAANTGPSGMSTRAYQARA